MRKQEAKRWLEQVIPRHERLTAIVRSLIENVLGNHQIDYLSVSGRTKSVEGAMEKISRKRYQNPPAQLTDLSGIRIVTYFESHAKEICKIVKELFVVDDENSLDRNKLLGMDRIGYRSTHFVCYLGDSRKGLLEYDIISDLKFEIQIRTVLQHAWAELAHDRSYKFSGKLPADLERKLNLYSGMLEIVDGGFDEIAIEVDKYKNAVNEKDFLTANSDDEIDSINLEKIVCDTSTSNNMDIAKANIESDIINELKRFGARNITQVESLLNGEFIEAQRRYQTGYDNYYGLLRNAMMFNDLERYFMNSWQEAWGSCDQPTFEMLSEKYGRNKVISIFEEYGMDIVSDV